MGFFPQCVAPRNKLWRTLRVRHNIFLGLGISNRSVLVMRLSCDMIDEVGHIANMAIASHHFTPSMKYQARIFVTLRPSVLDPAGTAVQSALKQMDYHVDSVRIGKYVEIVLEATDEAEASQKLDETCDKLLANPVIENYRFELTAIAQES